jgi:hypothetical protein
MCNMYVVDILDVEAVATEKSEADALAAALQAAGISENLPGVHEDSSEADVFIIMRFMCYADSEGEPAAPELYRVGTLLPCGRTRSCRGTRLLAAPFNLSQRDVLRMDGLDRCGKRLSDADCTALSEAYLPHPDAYGRAHFALQRERPTRFLAPSRVQWDWLPGSVAFHGSAQVRALGELRPLGSQAIQGGHVLHLHGLGEHPRWRNHRGSLRTSPSSSPCFGVSVASVVASLY